MSAGSVFEREMLPQLDALHGFAMQLCKDEQRSNDLVQETLLKACRYLHTYREGTNSRAWLFQICKNSYINSYRRKHYEPVLLDLRDEVVYQRSDEEKGREREYTAILRDESAEHTRPESLSDEVLAAFQTIPPDYQTALVLCDIEGYTYEEIAEYMAAPIGTIRSRIHRGRRMLARALAGYAHRQGYVSPSVERHAA